MSEYSQKRVRERLDLRLPVRVLCRETSDFHWEAITHLNNVTPFGCGFTLKRPTERGRLLLMTIPMPRQLRVFDHAEDQYKVWAIVRYLRVLEPPTDRPPLFEVGVAFIGKHPPKTYEEDPTKRYEVAGSFAEKLTVADPLNTGGASSDQDARHKICTDVLLETLDEKGDVSQSEKTVTESLGAKGATLFSSLDIPCGRFVRLQSPQYGLTIYAVVRSRSTGADGLPRLEVEFVAREWPL